MVPKLDARRRAVGRYAPGGALAAARSVLPLAAATLPSAAADAAAAATAAAAALRGVVSAGHGLGGSAVPLFGRR